jgi:ferric-dicitrate binding protein FerR (iron transport regulator)
MPGIGPPLHQMREQPPEEPAAPSRRRRWLRLAVYLIIAAVALAVTFWAASRAASHMTYTNP